MQIGEFAAEQRPHLVRTTADVVAYLPPPLPPALEFDTPLVRQLSEADRTLGQLAGVGRTLPSPQLFTRALLRRSSPALKRQQISASVKVSVPSRQHFFDPGSSRG